MLDGMSSVGSVVSGYRIEQVLGVGDTAIVSATPTPAPRWTYCGI